MSIESTEIADHSQRHIRVPTSAWALYQLNAVHDASVSRTSLNLGVAGIAVMCMVASTVSSIGLSILMNIDGPGHPFVSRVVYMSVGIVLGLTPLVLVGFAIAAPLLRNGPVFPRFLQAFLGGMFGWGGILLALAVAARTGIPEQLPSIARASAIYSISLAITVFVLQLRTSWSLQEFQRQRGPRWRLSTQDLLAVTLAFAVLCALFLGGGTNNEFFMQFFLAGFGVVAGGLSGWLLLTFVSRASKSTPLLLVFAFVIVAPLLAILYRLMFPMTANEFVQLFGFLYGFALIVALNIIAVGWLAAAWLRACGWRCVNDEPSRWPADTAND